MQVFSPAESKRLQIHSTAFSSFCHLRSTVLLGSCGGQTPKFAPAYPFLAVVLSLPFPHKKAQKKSGRGHAKSNKHEGRGRKRFFVVWEKERRAEEVLFGGKKGAEDRAPNPCLVSLLERRNGHTGIKKETDIAPTTPTGRTDGREREGRAQLTVRNQFPVLAVVVVYVGKKSSEGGGEKN